MLMYWWFSIFRPQDWMYWDVSFLRLPLVVTAFFLLRSLIVDGMPKISGILLWLMLIWIGLAGLATLLNGCQSYFGSGFMRFFLIILCAILTERLLTTERRIYGLMLLVTFSLGIYGANQGIGTILSGGGTSYGISNLTGTFTGSNAYALGLAMIILFFPFLCTQSKIFFDRKVLMFNLNTPKANKLFLLLCGVSMVGCIYCVISLFSRGSALALALGFLCFIILLKGTFKYLVWATIAGMIGLAVLPIPQGYVDRIESIFAEEDERDNSAKSRPHFWGVASNMVADNPSGVGLGCYPSYYDQYDDSYGEFGSARSVHSSHFQVLAEVGYVGFVLWLLMFFVSFKKLHRIRRESRDKEDRVFFLHLAYGLTCSQVVFLVGGAFYEFAHNEFTWLTFAIVVATEKLFLKKHGERSHAK